MNPVQKHLKQFYALRWVCRGVVLLTVSVSVWANVLHADPSTVPVVLAALPPVIALGAWELVSRIPIRTEARWFIRLSRPLATIALFGGAAYLSYFHQRSAILHYSNGDQSASMILPGLIDGLMIITSVSVFELNARIQILEATLTGQALQVSKPKAIESSSRREPNGKERVAQVLAKNPTITVTELARKAKVSEPYAYTLARELRSLGGAELVDQM